MVVSNIFYFHPYLGKWSHFTNIFQMGWNHQPEFQWIFRGKLLPVGFQGPGQQKTRGSGPSKSNIVEFNSLGTMVGKPLGMGAPFLVNPMHIHLIYHLGLGSQSPFKGIHFGYDWETLLVFWGASLLLQRWVALPTGLVAASPNLHEKSGMTLQW